jgi:hypothetical protein
MNKRRIGKVARLPEIHRELVNQCLKEGVAYNLIAAKLKTLGHPDITEQNIQNWKQGGYQEWLHAQEHREFVTKQSLALVECGKNSDAVANGITILGIAQLWNVLSEFDPALLKQRLAERPECYFDLVLAFNRFLKSRQAVLERIPRPKARRDVLLDKAWDTMIEDMSAQIEAAAGRRKKASQQQEQDEEQEEQETATPAGRVPSPGVDNCTPPQYTDDQRPTPNDQ